MCFMKEKQVWTTSDLSLLTFWNNIKSIIPNILEQNGFFISNALLFGDTTLNDPSNTIILNMTVDYIMSTKRFNDSTFTF